MTKNLTAEQLQILAHRITDIASMCMTLRTAGNRILNDTDGSDSAYHGSVVEALAQHMGALADNCSQILQSSGVMVGDFIDWRMSPVERQIAAGSDRVHALALGGRSNA